MNKLANDGFQWKQGLTSNPKAWTLVDPDGDHIAHAYPGNDKTWTAVWGDGEQIGTAFATSGEALRAVDDVARPCAYVDTHASHGIVPCDNDREPGSPYCTPHKAKVERDEKDGDRPEWANDPEFIAMVKAEGEPVYLPLPDHEADE